MAVTSFQNRIEGAQSTVKTIQKKTTINNGSVSSFLNLIQLLSINVRFSSVTIRVKVWCPFIITLFKCVANSGIHPAELLMTSAYSVGMLKTPQSLRRCALLMVVTGGLVLVCGIVLLVLSFINTLESKLSVLRWEGAVGLVIGLTFIFGAIAVFNIAKKHSIEQPTKYHVDQMQTQTRDQNTLNYVQATDVDLVTGTDMEIQVVTERCTLPYKHYNGNVRGFPGGYVNNIY